MQTTRLVDELRKPICKIYKFSGNPLEYIFFPQFRSKVTQYCQDCEECGRYLQQLTEGEANKIGRGFTYLDAKMGFPAAVEELEDRYGDVDVLAFAYFQRLQSGQSSDMTSLNCGIDLAYL